MLLEEDDEFEEFAVQGACFRCCGFVFGFAWFCARDVLCGFVRLRIHVIFTPSSSIVCCTVYLIEHPSCTSVWYAGSCFRPLYDFLSDRAMRMLYPTFAHLRTFYIVHKAACPAFFLLGSYSSADPNPPRTTDNCSCALHPLLFFFLLNPTIDIEFTSRCFQWALRYLAIIIYTRSTR